MDLSQRSHGRCRAGKRPDRFAINQTPVWNMLALCQSRPYRWAQGFVQFHPSICLEYPAPLYHSARRTPFCTPGGQHPGGIKNHLYRMTDVQSFIRCAFMPLAALKPAPGAGMTAAAPVTMVPPAHQMGSGRSSSLPVGTPFVPAVANPMDGAVSIPPHRSALRRDMTSATNGLRRKRRCHPVGGGMDHDVPPPGSSWGITCRRHYHLGAGFCVRDIVNKI